MSPAALQIKSVGFFLSDETIRNEKKKIERGWTIFSRTTMSRLFALIHICVVGVSEVPYAEAEVGAAAASTGFVQKTEMSLTRGSTHTGHPYVCVLLYKYTLYYPSFSLSIPSIILLCVPINFYFIF